MGTGIKLFIGMAVLLMLGIIPAAAAAIAGENQSPAPRENPRQSFFITIDPIGDHYSGDPILINGSTNLSITGKLRVAVYSASFHPGFRGVFYGISQAVPVVPGENSSMNRWSIEVPTNNWTPEEYLATAFPDTDNDTHDRGYAGQVFSLLAADERPAGNITPVKTVSSSVPDQATSYATPARTTSPRPTPLSFTIALAAIGTVLIVSGIRERKN